MSLQIIKSKFSGRCAQTGETFREGDLIVYDHETKKTFLPHADFVNTIENRNAFGLTDPAVLETFVFQRSKRGPLATLTFSEIQEMRKAEIISYIFECDGPDKEEETIVRKGKRRPKKIPKNIKNVFHKEFDRIMEYTKLNIPIYLVGPAGSGKSKVVRQVAEKLKREFYGESISKQTPVSKLVGYMDATGNYIGTAFRKAFERGGVFLLDEIDAANPNVLTSLNDAIAVAPGETISFPDGMIKRHKEFRLIAAANTFGTGADRQYVGRNPLDAASLDRFAFIEFDYDEKMEYYLAQKEKIDLEWVDVVQLTRAAVNELKIRHVISPRASLLGGRLLKAGRKYEEVFKSILYKGLDDDTVRRIEDRREDMI